MLIAGADAGTRATLREELRALLPAGTRFSEARETWELIARACTSDMVVLAGYIGEVSVGSSMTLLARRHPTLPVLAVCERTPAPGAADVDVAGS